MKLFGKILAYLGYSAGAVVAAVMEFMPNSIDKTAGTIIILTGALTGIGLVIHTVLKNINTMLDNRIKKKQLENLEDE